MQGIRLVMCLVCLRGMSRVLGLKIEAGNLLEAVAVALLSEGNNGD